MACCIYDEMIVFIHMITWVAVDKKVGKAALNTIE